MDPVDPFHHRIANIALTVAQQHGFALGGGLALIAHGVLQRPTEDVDLFSDREGSVAAATDLVDVGAFLTDHTPAQLIAQAHTVDPGFEDEEVEAVSRRLEGMPDYELANYGLDAAAIADLRRKFEAWPGSTARQG